MFAGSIRNNIFQSPVLIFLLVISLSGCLSEIVLEVPDANSSSIAIRGVLKATEEPSILVKITNVTNFNATDIPEAVIGASVFLVDESEHRLEIPMEGAGIYKLTIPDGRYDLEVKPGRSYQLSVTTPNGKNYLSTLETLNPVPLPTAVRQISEIRKEINAVGNIVDQKFLRFLITSPVVTPDSDSRAYLKWSFVGTYKFQESSVDSPFPPNVRTCYFFEDLNLEKVVTYNGSESNREVLSDFFILEEPLDYRFYQGFYLSVFQQSLTEGAYRYWNNIGKVVDLSGSFFEAPPGKVSGNFHNVDDDTEEVFGYFYATQEVFIRYYVPPAPEEVVPFCPAIVADPKNAPTVCLNCLSRKGSTLIKPDFWEE